jgi:putative FmdB family regulatory protein
MPIYEYRCASCGFEKEYLQKVNDPLLTDCPECGKSTFSKLVSAAGFQLKGNGWYVTDFRGNGGKPAAGKEKSADEAKSGDSEKSRDSEKSGDSKKDDKPGPACGTGACAA